MSEKRKLSLGRMLKDIIFMVPSLFFSVTNITAILSAEAQLAVRSLVMLVICCLFIAALLTAAWLCLLGMLLTWLLSMQLNLIVCFLILFVCNVVLLGILFFIVNRYRKRLSFPATTAMLRRFLP